MVGINQQQTANQPVHMGVSSNEHPVDALYPVLGARSLEEEANQKETGMLLCLSVPAYTSFVNNNP